MIRSQADQRRSQKMYDQHGREYFASIEKASGYPTGLISCLYEAPVFPPQQYLKINPDKPQELTVDYEAWIRDLEEAHRGWKERMVQIGVLIHGSAFDSRRDLSPEVAFMVGPKPYPVEPVLACRQGSRWALGLSSEMPPEAHRWFPAKEEEESLVFSDVPVSDAEPVTEPSMTGEEMLAAILSQPELVEIIRECPGNLRGVARLAWIKARLRERAGAAAGQES